MGEHGRYLGPQGVEVLEERALSSLGRTAKVCAYTLVWQLGFTQVPDLYDQPGFREAAWDQRTPS